MEVWWETAFQNCRVVVDLDTAHLDCSDRNHWRSDLSVWKGLAFFFFGLVFLCVGNACKIQLNFWLWESCRISALVTVGLNAQHLRLKHKCALFLGIRCSGILEMVRLNIIGRLYSLILRWECQVYLLWKIALHFKQIAHLRDSEVMLKWNFSPSDPFFFLIFILLAM